MIIGNLSSFLILIHQIKYAAPSVTIAYIVPATSSFSLFCVTNRVAYLDVVLTFFLLERGDRGRHHVFNIP